MYNLRIILGGVGFALATLIAPVWQPVALAAAPQVTGVRVGVYPAKTRIVLDVSSAVKFSAFILPEPYRVVVDMSEVTWSPEMRNPPSGGLVTGMRFGLFKPGSSRVVLDSAGPVRVAKAFIVPPSGRYTSYRLVVDIAKTSRQAFMRAYKPAKTPHVAKRVRAPARLPVPFRRKPPAAQAKKLIMIDPGHGGVDPGAMSRSGVWEKNIVLAFARELRRGLLATGQFRVLMTRDRDVFVRLRNRIAIARRAGADLFISVHADSIRNSRVRGTSVYTLSERASDKEADTLAQKENKSDLIAGVDLKEQSDDVVNILIDLAQRETMNESAVFARKLVNELGKTRKMLRNTHRFAGFAVLKAPDIPSVLVELGYLSNRSDERLLTNPKKRRSLARAMARAVQEYFERQQALNRP
jgi:N-acetylmuramoyl-L-alanine amidase